MNTKLIYPIFLALVLLVPGNVLVFGQGQSGQQIPVQVFAIGLETIHEIELRATEVNGQQINVDNFVIKPESVVQIQSGNNLQVFTTMANSPIEKVKITNTLGQTTELVLLQQSNVYSLSGVPAGVYILDIIVRTNDGLAAYETILVVLQPGEQPKNPTDITKIFISTNVKTIIKFPRDNQTKGNQTKPLPPKNDTKPLKCDEGFELTDDGRCVPICLTEANGDQPDGCEELPPIDPCETENPPLTCGEEPEPCTPDGPECPPCPEGVEESWCADEDERQDTDDGLGEEESEEGEGEGVGTIDIPSQFGGEETEEESQNLEVDEESDESDSEGGEEEEQ